MILRKGPCLGQEWLGIWETERDNKMRNAQRRSTSIRDLASTSVSGKVFFNTLNTGFKYRVLTTPFKTNKTNNQKTTNQTNKKQPPNMNIARERKRNSKN